MNNRKYLFLPIFSVILSTLQIAPSQALSDNILEASNSRLVQESPIGNQLNQSQLSFIKKNRATFEFAGTLCRIDSISGCKVVKSKNSSFPVGFVFKPIVADQNYKKVSQSAFNMTCPCVHLWRMYYLLRSMLFLHLSVHR
jgi:hypothetical protein